MSGLPKFITLLTNPKMREKMEKWMNDGQIDTIEKFIQDESDVVKSEFYRWKVERNQENRVAPAPTNYGTPGNYNGPRFQQAPLPPQLQPQYYQMPPPLRQRPLGYPPTVPQNGFRQPPPNQHVAAQFQAGNGNGRGLNNFAIQENEMLRKPLNDQEVDEYMHKKLKDTDLTWIFSFPKSVAGLVVGKKFMNVNRYSMDNYVDLKITPHPNADPITVKIDGSGTSFENTHTVCMDVWKRLSTNERCESRRLTPTLSKHVNNLAMSQFQQLLFMEDFQVYLLNQGLSWKLFAFSEEQLDKAEAILSSISRFRQNEPVSPTGSMASLSSFSSTLTLNSSPSETPVPDHATVMSNASIVTVVKAPPKPKPRKKFQNKKAFKKPVYNPQTFNTPKRAIFVDEDSIANRLKKSTNILLLGQSGVGKSTFLNAFGNYLEFGTNFPKAEKDLKVYIHAKYDLPYDDREAEPLTVELKPSDGEIDGNEVLEYGKSATQEARCYTFQCGQKEIRIIDTPGLIDTGGPEKDQLNIARILKCLKQFPTIQSIVFLLRHDECRATASLKWCLGELLKRLHHDAAKNILFVFPKTDILQPPATIKTLEDFFVQVNGDRKVRIEMNIKTTVFRLDNFGFLYLGGRKFGGYQEMGSVRAKAEKCWNYAAKDVENLLKAISVLPDYEIKKTLEIQDTKICLEAFARPMVDLSRQILTNKAKLQEKETEIMQLLGENKSLAGRLHCEQTLFVRRPVDSPRLCCFSDNCSTAVSAADRLPRICHDSCNCIQGDEETGTALLACDKFNKQDGRCKSCFCGFNTHRITNYDLYKSTREVVPDAVVDTARANLTERDRALMKCTALRSECLKLEQSLELLRKNGAIFAAFIKQNALHVEADDSFEQHLKQCIQVARNSGSATLENLEKFKEQYNQEKTMFALANGQERKISYHEVLQKLRELEEDKTIGKQVQEYTNLIGIYSEDAIAEEKKLVINALFDQKC